MKARILSRVLGSRKVPRMAHHVNSGPEDLIKFSMGEGQLPIYFHRAWHCPGLLPLSLGSQPDSYLNCRPDRINQRAGPVLIIEIFSSSHRIEQTMADVRLYLTPCHLPSTWPVLADYVISAPNMPGQVG